MKCSFKITLKKITVVLKVGWYAYVLEVGRRDGEKKKFPFKIIPKAVKVVSKVGWCACACGNWTTYVCVVGGGLGPNSNAMIQLLCRSSH